MLILYVNHVVLNCDCYESTISITALYKNLQFSSRVAIDFFSSRNHYPNEHKESPLFGEINE